jgi:ABC-type transport system substrate-binding protein
MNKKHMKITALLAISLFAAAPIVTIGMVTAQAPLFTIYIGVGDNNPARIAWAGVISDSFRRIGIDSRVSIGTWGGWLDRVLFPLPEDLGAVFTDGGWDSIFIGWNWGSSWIDPTSLYDNDSIPIFNWCLINDPEVEVLLENIRSELNSTQRILYQKELQALTHEISALQILLYENETWAYDPDMTGFPDISQIFPTGSDPKIRIPGSDQIIIGVNTDPEDFNDMMSTAYYDGIAYGVCYDGLFFYASNDDMSTFTQTPMLAASDWVVENSGYNWTLSLRDDVYWPTGHKFNASDVVMTWKAIVTPDVGSARYGDYITVGLNNESFHIMDEFTVRVTFNETGPLYAWTPQLLNMVSILPYAQLNSVPFDQWRTHGITSGAMWTADDVAGGTMDIYGPMGLGPYVCRVATSGWDLPSRTFIADIRGGTNDPGISNGTVYPYYKGVNGWGTTPMPNQWVYKAITGAAQAITSLQTGEIDLVDTNFAIAPLRSTVDPAWGTLLFDAEIGFQSFGLNMMHPIFGTGEATPNGITDPDNAAMYAQYVRQALNYLIPREAIVDQILDGFGVPGNEYMPPSLAAFNDDIEPYRYDTEEAKRLLRLAGYEIPEFIPPPPIALYAAVGVAVTAIVIAVIAIYLWRKR